MIKMMMTNIPYGKIFLINLIIVILCIIFDKYNWLLNIQIAFITSFLISMATFFSYKNNVIKSLDKYSSSQQDIDCISNIEDRYDLYSDDIDDTLIENPTKEQIQEEMKPIKQNHIKNLKSTILSYSSFYRIFAYAILIVGFFYLNNNNLLNIIPYLIGFLIIPVGSLFVRIYK